MKGRFRSKHFCLLRWWISSKILDSSRVSLGMSRSGQVVYRTMIDACCKDSYKFKLQPEPPSMLEDTSVDQKGFACRTNLYTVSRCCTRGESDDHTSEKARKRSTLTFKPG